MKMRKLLFAIITAMSVVMFNACEEETADPCENVTCGVNGTCVDGTCDCDPGYEGTECESIARTKFFGNYTAVDSPCTTAPYDVEIVTSAAGVDTILLKDFGKFLCNSDAPDVKAGVDESTLTIPSQTFCSGLITISGSGSISSDTLTITITYETDTTGGTTFDCTSILTRQ